MYLSTGEKVAGSILTVLGIIPGLIFWSFKSRKPSIKALDQYIAKKNPKLMTVKVIDQQRQVEIVEFMKGKGFSIAKESEETRVETNQTGPTSNYRNRQTGISIGSFNSTSRTITTHIITFQKN